MTDGERPDDGLAAFEVSRDHGFYSLVALGQAVHACGVDCPAAWM